MSPPRRAPGAKRAGTVTATAIAGRPSIGRARRRRRAAAARGRAVGCRRLSEYMTSDRPPALAERALAQRVLDVPPSGIRRFFDILATMDDVISLGVGEPDFDTPRAIVEAGVESPPRGADPLHLQLRDDRAPQGPLGAPRAALRRPLRPRDRDPHHGRCVRGGRPRAASHLRSGRRGHPPRAVVCRLRPGHRVRGRDRPPRRDPLRGRLRARPGGRRGRDHPADQGALPRLSVQPDRGRPAAGDPGRAGGRSRSATTSSSTATRSTTASPTGPTPTGR